MFSAERYLQEYLCSLMQLYELVFTILVIYLLYKLIFNVVVPVAKVSFQVRSRMRNMQGDPVKQQPRSNSHSSDTTTDKKATTTASDSEYIDFEEIK